MTESEELLKPLLIDVFKCKEAIKKEDNQFNRRNLVRAIFVFFEASLNNLKGLLKVLLLDEKLTNKKIEIAELVPLLDEDIRLNSNGTIYRTHNKYSFKNQSAFIFKKFSEHLNFDENILGDHRWDSFQKALDLRNRIIHPNIRSDVNISDEELEKVYEAEKWWVDNLVRFWGVE